MNIGNNVNVGSVGTIDSTSKSKTVKPGDNAPSSSGTGNVPDPPQETIYTPSSKTLQSDTYSPGPKSRQAVLYSSGTGNVPDPPKNER